MDYEIKARVDINRAIAELNRRRHAAVDQAIVGAVTRLVYSTPVRTGRARSGWKYRDGKISNDVPYISALNMGASKQAPAHYVERALLADPRIQPNGTIVRTAR